MTAESPAVSVLVADSHPLYLIGLVHTVRRSPELSLVAAPGNGPEALALIQEHQPQVAVLDLPLLGLDAREVMRALRIEERPTRVLVLSEHQTGELVMQCLTAGATGFLRKYVTPTEIRDAILTASRGQAVLPDEVGETLVGVLQQRGEGPWPGLTPRELEVLRFLAQGESAASLATRLGISLATTKTHIQNLYIKLGAGNRAAAVATAIRRGLIE